MLDVADITTGTGTQFAVCRGQAISPVRHWKNQEVPVRHTYRRQKQRRQKLLF